MQQAIAATYALRPSESPTDSVFGLETGGGISSAADKRKLLLTAGIILATAVLYGYAEGVFDPYIRQVSRTARYALR